MSDYKVLECRVLVPANEALQLTRAQQFGVGIVLEDIQAQQAVTQARSGYITAVAEFDKAPYALHRAVGGRPPIAGSPP